MDNDFLNIAESNKKEAKWNLFKFQDHLLSWIYISAQHLQDKDYPSSFEALTIVYTDAYGFFNEKEKTELDKLFEETSKHNIEYIQYNIKHDQISRKVKNHTYLPPMMIYTSLLKFRKKLMIYMTKQQLLIPQVRKSMAGAGDL